MSKTSPNQGIGEKQGDHSNVSKNIVKQGIEGSLGYCAKGTILLSSPMSKTRSKQDIGEKWGDNSNVSKTIVKQGIEGSLGYCANGPMAIGKSEFEGGMATYAKNGRQLKYVSASQQGGCTQKRSTRIVAPHHPKANVGVVLILQYYQHIIR